MTVKMFVVRMIELCKAEEEAGRCPRDSEGNQCPLYRFHCGIPEEKSEIDEMLKTITDYKKHTEGICPKCKANLKKVTGVHIIKYCPICGEKMRFKTLDSITIQEANNGEGA